MLAVLAYHLSLPLSGGFLGVDAFFVISGFLIGQILITSIREGGDGFRLRDFYLARWRRLAPTFTVFLLGTSLAAVYVLSPTRLSDFFSQLRWSVAGAYNILALSGSSYELANPRDAILLHTWSLGVEEQFYLVIPLLLLAALRNKRTNKKITWLLFFVASVSFVHSLLMAQVSTNLNFFLPSTRAWQLLAGVILAANIRAIDHFLRESRRTVVIFLWCLGCLGLSISFLFMSGLVSGPGIGSLLPVLSTVIMLATGKLAVSPQIWRRTGLVWTGRISYPLYLFHFPIIALVPSLGVGYVLDAIYLAGLAILAAWLVHIFVEQPARRGPRSRIWAAASALVLSAVFLASFFGSKAAAGGTLSEAPVVVDSRLGYGPIASYSSTRQHVILLGDSQMDALAPSLFSEAQRIELAFASWTEEGCPFLLGVERARKENDEVSLGCGQELQERRLSWLEGFSPSLVIIGGRFPLVVEGSRFDNGEGGVEGPMNDYFRNSALRDGSPLGEEGFSGALRDTVSRVINMGHTVVILDPIPEVGWHVPDRIRETSRGRWPPSNPVTTSYARFLERTASTRKVLDGLGPGVARVSPARIFCSQTPSGRCETHSDTQIFYRDSNHLSGAGAEKLARYIVDELVVHGLVSVDKE